MKCPNCGNESPREMHFCGNCGKQLRTACAECGFANPLDYRFCGMCGMQLLPDVVRPDIEPPFPIPSSEAEPLISTTPPQLEGERRVISVVLTDLTDSTNLLERVGTEDWVEHMNRILHILESEIYRFGGEVSQFRGDGLVALFGATSAHEDDPERAVLAALSMQRAFNHYLRELAQPETSELRMRVGVNTGEVIVASGSERQQWEETAMGMAVTIAARMEAAAEPGTVLVSEHTYRLVASQFDWQPLGEISIKGVSQPVEVYRPQSHITDTELLSSGGAFPETLPRIGRDTEFHALKHCIEGLFEGRGRIATLTGDKGSGKSFLLSEVRQYFAHREALLAETQATTSPSRENSLTWVRGRCRSYSQRWPYSMWLELFRDWLGIRAEDSKEAKSAALRRRMEALWGENVDEHYPYLATFLGFPLEETLTEKIRHLDGEGLRQRCFLAVRSWIEEVSRRSPLVMAFSDLQWADDSSLDLLKYCLPVCDNETLLFLLSFRPEPDATISKLHHLLNTEYPHRLTSVNLPPLSEAQSWELINHLIGPRTLPQETGKLIIHNAEGNPYYILELIRSLIESGVLALDADGDSWRLTRTVTTLDLPDSLHRLLLSRIDHLTGQQRLVLQIAAVIGPVFWLNMLQALLGESQTLKTDLAALQRAQFIQESGRFAELGMQYFFKSPLIRDTVYDSLLNTQRTTYHLKAAEFLENSINPDILEDYDGMLAYHYRGAGNPKKELFYTFLAAEHERKIHANAEALQHYDRALELLDILKGSFQSKEQTRAIQTQRFEVLNGRRHVHFQMGQFVAGRTDTQALLPLAREMDDDPVWLVDALIAQADVSTDNRQDLLPGLQMAEEALTLARQLGDQNREMRSLTRIANVRFTLNDPKWRELAEHALLLARKLGDLKTEVNLLLGIGGKYGMDDLPRGREYLKEALSRSEALNDMATRLPLLQAMGQQFERDGDYYCQLTEYEQQRLRLSREIGNRFAEGNALMFCGQIQALYLGDYETGLELELQALHCWENITDRLFPLLRIAQIQTALGRTSEALATLELANPLGGKVIYDIGRAGLGLVTINLYNTLGGERYLGSALEIAGRIKQMAADNLVSRQYHMAVACESSSTHLKLAQYLGEHHPAGNEHQTHLVQALESSKSALTIYQKFGFVQVVECTSEEILFRHSQALEATRQTSEAAEFLKRAYEEMMRKHELIPKDSLFQKTYLENIPLHRDIQSAYANQPRAESSTQTSASRVGKS